MLAKADKYSEDEKAFVKTMLDSSIHAILLVEPLYEDGVVNDFEIKATNNALTAHAAIQPEEVIGIPISQIFLSARSMVFLMFIYQHWKQEPNNAASCFIKMINWKVGLISALRHIKMGWL